MTNKQILEDYKEGINHPGFAVFYCKELDKHIIHRLPVKDEEKEVVLSEFEKNGLPPEGYSISVKSTGAVIKPQNSEKIEKNRYCCRSC
jgi:UDP-galactopyranose mutase